jgi:hypothetical protein
MIDSNAGSGARSPLGKGSPDEPASTLPGEPARITKLADNSADGAGRDLGGLSRLVGGSDAGRTKAPGNEEPEPALEPDLPTDGRDLDGEAMIRDLPKRRELSDAPPEPADRR